MNILIIKTSSMGDVIHTLPALTDALQYLQNIPIEKNDSGLAQIGSSSLFPLNFTWVVEEGFAEIPQWHKAVTRVIPIALRRWRKNIFSAQTYREVRNFLRELRREKYDFVIDAQGLLKSAVVARLAKGIKCGYDYHSVREPLASLFYQQKYFIDKNLHAITRIRKLFANIFNYELSDNLPNYGIDISPNNAENSAKYLVFIHGTTAVAKYWPEKNWIKLANLAIKNGFAVKIPWGNQEEFLRAERISKNSGAEVLPKLKLSDLAILLSQAHAVIAVDTGLGHLAAALNIPTISLYGKTDPKLIGTVGANVTHVTDFQNVDAEEIFRILPH
jgi:heptosyltransferase I